MRATQDPWPLPERPARRRFGNAVGLALGGVIAVAAGVVGADVNLGAGCERSVRDRLRSIDEGADELVSAAVFGTAGWCPRFPGWGVLTLSTSGVTYSQGVARRIPVDDLSVVGVRPVHGVSAPLRLPRRGWVVDVAGAGAVGTIALRSREDVVVLGAVAGWPPPPDWPR